VYLQESRRAEILHCRERDVKSLADSLAALAHATRRARTALWSALQATQHIGVDREIALGFQEPQVRDLYRKIDKLTIMD
jgi:Meiosis-specific coiled-coil domain-containing protein MEIOC